PSMILCFFFLIFTYFFLFFVMRLMIVNFLKILWRSCGEIRHFQANSYLQSMLQCIKQFPMVEFGITIHWHDKKTGFGEFGIV
ncbi:MAG: hypothetical protein ACTSXP_13885, partial [Promethearchaeota archaeon]